MDYAQAFAISAAGMSLERTRVEVAATNLAHANTVQDPASAGYRPMHVIARSLATPSFGHIVDGGLGALPPATVSVEPQGGAPRLAHEPGHPLANAQGFVSYPGVDPAAEMVTLMAAMRSYEANLSALNTARTLALRTLDIGRGS
jgi:flagellar basal-body rod protein FlgC